MEDVLIPLLVDILCELTQIRIVLTYDFDPEEIAQDAAKIISSQRYLSTLIKGFEIKEV